MTAMIDAFIADLDDHAIDRLVAMLGPKLAAAQTPPSTRTNWLDVTAAAEYLACPKSRIYALVSARRIPHHKDGSRTLFRADELDTWVRSGGARRP